MWEARQLACAEVEGLGSTLLNVGAERDELRRLVEQLPDDRVQPVLAEVRRQSGHAVRPRHTGGFQLLP